MDDIDFSECLFCIRYNNILIPKSVKLIEKKYIDKDGADPR